MSDTTAPPSRPESADSADSADKLAEIRSILNAEQSPDAALDAIAQVIGQRQPPGPTYQKAWG